MARFVSGLNIGEVAEKKLDGRTTEFSTRVFEFCDSMRAIYPPEERTMWCNLEGIKALKELHYFLDLEVSTDEIVENIEKILDQNNPLDDNGIGCAKFRVSAKR